MASTKTKIPNIGQALEVTTSPTLVAEYMTATTVTGTPAAGKFYSDISGRAPLIDPSKKPNGKFGVERIYMNRNLTEVSGEVGPSGQIVYQGKDDRIRFVGPWKLSLGSSNNDGPSISASDPWSNPDEYLEVTFYGTGLNMFMLGQGGTKLLDIDIDGVAGSAVDFSQSEVLGSRDYPPHNLTNVVSGLALGLHTVTIKGKSGVAGEMFLNGIEILNESTSITIPEGSVTSGGALLSTAATTTDLTTFDLAYQDGSTSITDATKGGCVSIYNENGAIKKAITYADSTQGNLGSADHSNEEVVQKFNWREFGVGRADDFSTLSTSNSDRAFTLDDGTTTLVGNDVEMYITKGSLQVGPTGSFFTLTFVGSGLDILRVDNSTGSENFSVFVDGVDIGTLDPVAQHNVERVETIVSGLPFGTHTVKIIRDAAIAYSIGVQDFIIYAPKKPTLPAGAVELGSAYKMADYDSSGTTGSDSISHLKVAEGVLAKDVTREIVYLGGVTLSSITPHQSFGFHVTYGTGSDGSMSYTFFGSGVQYHGMSGGGASAFTVEIDGVANATGVNIEGVTNDGGGSYTQTADGGEVNRRLDFTGLTLGFHTIKFSALNGAGLQSARLYIITPFYSYTNDVLNLTDYLVGSNTLKSEVLIPGATDKKIIATQGIEGLEDTVTLFLDNNFLTGQVVLVKIGRMVTMSALSSITHTSVHTPATTIGFLPEKFRPSFDITNTTYYDDTAAEITVIASDGTIYIQHRSESGPVAETISGALTMSWVVP